MFINRFRNHKEELIYKLGLDNYGVELEDIDDVSYSILVLLEFKINKYLEDNNATEEERRLAWNWVEEGSSLMENPYYIADERGKTMHFLEGLRAGNELHEYNLDYQDDLPYDFDDDPEDNTIPF